MSARNYLTQYKVSHDIDFTSKFFKKETIRLGDRSESIVRGNREMFKNLPNAFKAAGIKKICVIGWGSQGPAQAQNLRDSLKGSDVSVKVGLRKETLANVPESVTAAGFSVADGTLGEMYEVLRESDLAIVLISDAAMADNYQKIFDAMKPGATLGLSHGFLLGCLQSRGEKFPEKFSVIAVCPKGMGPSVRRLYEQGASVNGAGINCSFCVHQDLTGHSADVALAWAVGVGSPVTFQTTLEAEYKSDIFGERGVLLGAVHGLTEVLYRHFRRQGRAPEASYLSAVESITGPVSRAISHKGTRAVYDAMSAEDKAIFERAYSAAYHPAMDVLLEIYEDVASGREIASVVDHARRFRLYPMGKIDDTELWRVGAKVRAARSGASDPAIDPVAAGAYCAVMVAQAELLLDAGHAYSEVANESIIEAVDSLNPYMHHKGVAYMVDNCSVTARLGSRKWAPRFDYNFEQQMVPKLEADAPADKKLIDAFKTHRIHDIMKVCAELRPPVDIAPK